eukprot:CAMPEP_0174896338 /NCGR_PEP_ID=MMETSP0167-20121228/10535_1 /TAXON_ID=38298 /ORGANISM="Rhodella maculata, Strain CCMP736" /LENGTH=129 /DNA_ID=CAMNT_0016135865 /DNA_START=211 /DNA_END=598 /DNA_ORIENTATION=+
MEAAMFFVTPSKIATWFRTSCGLSMTTAHAFSSTDRRYKTTSVSKSSSVMSASAAPLTSVITFGLENMKVEEVDGRLHFSSLSEADGLGGSGNLVEAPGDWIKGRAVALSRRATVAEGEGGLSEPQEVD